jgi:hypothetical protein
MRVSREPRDPAARSMTGIKLAIAAVGLFVWGFGMRADDARIRWVGIAMLAIAFLLRFLPVRRAGE